MVEDDAPGCEGRGSNCRLESVGVSGCVAEPRDDPGAVVDEPLETSVVILGIGLLYGDGPLVMVFVTGVVLIGGGPSIGQDGGGLTGGT